MVCGKAYFEDLKRSMLAAKRSVLICGWSLNLDTVMDEEGTTFKNLVFSLPENVSIKILIWDYIIFYVGDRDPFLPLKMAFQNKKNVEFQRFDFHPIMSSMHSKMVVVDEEVLYLGGIDIDLERRDGQYNLTKDPARRLRDGKTYQPFRDYVLKFNGPAGKRFASFFNELWNSQRDQKSELSGPLKGSKDDNVFFARTVPKFKDNPKDYSSYYLHKWLILKARKYIYIENQYLTSESIVRLLIKRLSEPEGPEVVLVVSYGKMPVLEKISMGALLTESARKLFDNDPHGRLKIYALFSGKGGQFVKVHSKCLLVDDEYLKIGSSNINDRSMRFDYELDVLVRGEAAARNKKKIFSTLLTDGKDELVFEPGLGATFEKARVRWGKLVEVRDILHERSPFVEYKDYLPLDKKQMTFFEKTGQILLEKSALRRINYKLLAGALALVLILTGALVVEPGEAKERLDQFIVWLEVQNGFGLMAMFFAGYLLLGAMFFPLNVYIFLCGAYFDTFDAFALAVSGATASASLSYAIGAWFKTEIHAESRIKKLNQLRRLLKKNSLKTIVFLRMVPIAPFPLVNLICGKFGVGFPRYFLGTLLGVAPGSFVLIFMEKRLFDLIQSPEVFDFVLLALLGALGVYGAKMVRKRMSA